MKQKAIREILRQERERRKMTQTELANLAGVTQARISNFESGQDILLSTLSSIAGALGMQLTAILKEGPRPLVERRRQMTSMVDKYHQGED